MKLIEISASFQVCSAALRCSYGLSSFGVGDLRMTAGAGVVVEECSDTNLILCEGVV